MRQGLPIGRLGAVPAGGGPVPIKHDGRVSAVPGVPGMRMHGVTGMRRRLHRGACMALIALIAVVAVVAVVALTVRRVPMVHMGQTVLMALMRRIHLQRRGPVVRRSAAQHGQRGHALHGHREDEEPHQQETEHARHGGECSAAPAVDTIRTGQHPATGSGRRRPTPAGGARRWGAERQLPRLDRPTSGGVFVMTQQDASPFARRVLVVLGAVLLLALLWHLADVLVLVFGAIVVAVALRAFSGQLEHWRVPQRWSLAAALLLLLGFGALVVAWIGEPLAEQLSRLREGLPAALARATAWLREHRIGVTVLEYWNSLRQDAVPWSRLLGVAGSALGALGTLALIVITGVYMAADPGLYRRGVLSLLPPARRGDIATALDRCGAGLRQWLLGQSLSMLFVGSATALGLLALNVPLALAIGLISGLLAFIPFFGALVGGGLAVLVAFMEGPQTALHVLILCIAIQQVEGHVLMPLVQRWAVSLPPVLGLMSTLVFGVLFGLIGVLFATPMMVVVMTLVRCLYVERIGGALPAAPAPAGCRPSPTGTAAAVRSAAPLQSDGAREGVYLE